MALSAIVATFMFGMVPVSDAAPLLTIVGAETGSQSGSTRTLSSHGDWQVQCDTGDAISCRMSIGAEATSANGTRIAIELVGERPAMGEPLFYVRAPLDLLVATAWNCASPKARPCVFPTAPAMPPAASPRSA